MNYRHRLPPRNPCKRPYGPTRRITRPLAQAVKQQKEFTARGYGRGANGAAWTAAKPAARFALAPTGQDPSHSSSEIGYTRAGMAVRTARRALAPSSVKPQSARAARHRLTRTKQSTNAHRLRPRAPIRALLTRRHAGQSKREPMLAIRSRSRDVHARVWKAARRISSAYCASCRKSDTM